MIVLVSRCGKDRFGITLESVYPDICVLISVGETIIIQDLKLELYHIFGYLGLDITKNDGVYSTDIYGSGTHKLNRVEDQFGAMYNI